MKPVFGSPCSIVSMARCSAMQLQPLLQSLLLTVPLPTMEPARTLRVFARCAISWPKWKVISGPASHAPTLRPFHVHCRGRCSRPPDQVSPSSSGVTATGLNAVAGLPWRKPKPLPSSAGIRWRRLQSLASITRRTPSSACSGPAPIVTSPVTTATSPSKSMPQSALANVAGSQGPRKSSLPPWYISGSPKKLSGISAPRALRTSSTWLRYAEPSAHWNARGSGAMHCSGTNGNACRVLPWFSATDRSCSSGAMKFQSSRACCSRVAMPVAKWADVRSRETTTSWPSRDPSL